MAHVVVSQIIVKNRSSKNETGHPDNDVERSPLPHSPLPTTSQSPLSFPEQQQQQQQVSSFENFTFTSRFDEGSEEGSERGRVGGARAAHGPLQSNAGFAGKVVAPRRPIPIPPPRLHNNP